MIDGESEAKNSWRKGRFPLLQKPSMVHQLTLQFGTACRKLAIASAVTCLFDGIQTCCKFTHDFSMRESGIREWGSVEKMDRSQTIHCANMF